MRQVSVSPFAIRRVVQLDVRCLLYTVQNMRRGKRTKSAFENCFFTRLTRTQTPAWGVRHALARQSLEPRIRVQQNASRVFSSGAWLQNVDLRHDSFYFKIHFEARKGYSWDPAAHATHWHT